MWCVSAHHARNEAHTWTLECQNTKMLQMSQQGKDVLENVKKYWSSQTEHWKAFINGPGHILCLNAM